MNTKTRSSIRRVLLNLDKVTTDISKKRTHTAVHAVTSQGAAMASMLTPVDTGFLLNSQYTYTEEAANNVVRGVVGYTSGYAAYVHSASGKLAGKPRSSGKGSYWDPNGSPEFLTKGFERIRPKVLDIIKAAYAS